MRTSLLLEAEGLPASQVRVSSEAKMFLVGIDTSGSLPATTADLAPAYAATPGGIGKPRKTPGKYLDTLSALGLVVTANRLREYIELI